ncbi:MAG: peptidase S41 [Gemmatimonadetes bacterium]|nr:peptidase S41 [Gemmatimonadota bacterium]
MLRKTAVWMILLCAGAACTDAGPSEPDDSIGLQAHVYISSALDIMEFNSVRRYEIDWTAFREETFAEAAGIMTIPETYPVIVSALERIGDGHSFFQEPIASAPPAAGNAPSAALVDGVGYLDVPAFSGGGEDGDSLALLYHGLIEGVDTMAVQACRWVVDLRGNTGGNMWPMIAGVGPILGEDTVGFFVDPDSVFRSWTYYEGEARINDAPVNAAIPPYEPQSMAPHVAVLTDSLTASSGEAVAVAFRGRDGARSFGQPTWGLSTANAPFLLDDGAVIFLTVSTMVDRAGVVYGGELAPDEPVVGEKTGDPQTDEVLEAALTWLSTQSCA